MDSSTEPSVGTTARPAHGLLLPVSLVAVGFLWRLWLAYSTFLNPDEAWHYLLSAQHSFADAYRASLQTAHPPLLIMLLWVWRFLGHSEVWLRLPSVLAGTASAWIMFLWVDRVLDRTTALCTLVLLLFSPPLLSLSAEVRQYALLLLFCAAALYCFDRALLESSSWSMVASGAFLVLALLTHYSSLIFAFSFGIYGLLRFSRRGTRSLIASAWIVGQVSALTVVAWQYFGHIAELRRNGLSNEVAETYVRDSLYHPSAQSLIGFFFRNTTRLFRYLFSNGSIGILGLMLFLLGLGLLLWGRPGRRIRLRHQEPVPPTGHLSRTSLALLLLLPVLVTAGLSMAGLYPYGGIRHDIVLALFIFTAISIAIARWMSPRPLLMSAAVLASLLIANLRPHPLGPYISPRDQRKELLYDAIKYLQTLAIPASTILTDYEGGLLLSYYLCPSPVVNLDPAARQIRSWPCGPYTVVTPGENVFVFSPATFKSFRAVATALQSDNRGPYLFQAGWIGDPQRDLLPDDPRLGCRYTRVFSDNIFVCELASR